MAISIITRNDIINDSTVTYTNYSTFIKGICKCLNSFVNLCMLIYQIKKKKYLVKEKKLYDKLCNRIGFTLLHD